MITLRVSNDNGDCGRNCPFLDTWRDYCVLFKEPLETEQEWGVVSGRKACTACNMVVDKAESLELV